MTDMVQVTIAIIWEGILLWAFECYLPLILARFKGQGLAHA